MVLEKLPRNRTKHEALGITSQEFDVRLFDGELTRAILDEQTGEVLTLARALDAKAIMPENEQPRP